MAENGISRNKQTVAPLYKFLIPPIDFIVCTNDLLF